MQVVSISSSGWNIDHTQWDAVGIDNNGRAIHWHFTPGTGAGEGVVIADVLPMPPA